MKREVERRPVNRDEYTARTVALVEVDVRLHCLFRIHVNVRPPNVVRADGEKRQIERPVRSTQLLESGRVSAVTTEEDPVLRPGEYPRRPLRRVPDEATTGEVTSLRAREDQVVDLGRLVPVQFHDPVLGHLPVPQVSPDTDRHDERSGLCTSQGLDRSHVEMVVVIVRDDYRIHCRQFGQSHRSGVHACGTYCGRG